MRLLKITAIMCLTLFLFFGCVTNKFVFDKEIPDSEACTLIIEGTLTVVHFNENKVNWKDKGYGLFTSKRQKEAVVRIPAGENTITANYYNKNYLNFNVVQSRRADSLEVTYFFEPGYVYYLLPATIGNDIWLTIKKN